MENCVMVHDHIPEITFGDGKSKINFKGKEALRAAGWGLRLLLFARAVRILLLFPVGGIAFLLLRWVLSVVSR
jgi:hypothetical protein